MGCCRDRRRCAACWGRRACTSAPGNEVEIYADGATALAAMEQAIAAARQRIHLEVYILRSDTTGRRFIDALAARARAGVAVRLLYDAFGSYGLDAAALAPLVDAGGDVVAFNPLRPTYPRWLPRRRDHRKILVVDGAVGFVGGLNIGDEYDAGPADGARCWRDTHLRLTGPAVADLEAVFLESWFRADAPELPWRSLLVEPTVGRDGAEHCAVVADGPSYHRRVMRDLLVMGLERSTAEVLLTSPYFAPDHKVFQALTAASRRGVRVALLLAGLTDHPILRRAVRALLPRLLAAGVEVYEYERSMMHAKSTVVDAAWAIVGTSNLDRQSFEHSYEVNLVFDSGRVPEELAALFARDLTGAIRIDEGTLARRSWRVRLVDWCAALVLKVI